MLDAGGGAGAAEIVRRDKARGARLRLQGAAWLKRHSCFCEALKGLRSIAVLGRDTAARGAPQSL